MTLEEKRLYDAEYRKKNSEKLREYKRAYRLKLLEENPDKLRAQSRATYHKRKDRAQETAREWRSHNKDHVAAYGKAYRKKNRAEAREREAKYRNENPEKLWAKQLRRKGLTPDLYRELLTAQDNVCAVCRKPETHQNWYGLPKLAVDHDHKTGHVRGLLCAKCNKGLGQYDDSPDLLRAAATYLEETRICEQLDKTG